MRINIFNPALCTRISYLAIIFPLLAVFPDAVWSQANFTAPGAFKVLSNCKAYNSIRNKTGALTLVIGKSYPAYAENKPTSASHVLIDVNGSRKWLSLSCGKYDGDKPAFITAGGRPPSDADTACLPFFDNLDNPVTVGVGGNVDITPVAPAITSFGASVNRLCGAPGKVTNRVDFKQMMNKHPDVLSTLMKYTANKVFADRPAYADKNKYLDDLAEAWYAVSAFDHIFCGEPKSANAIGGLHYHGRYQQLQASRQACRMSNYSRNEVVPGSIYTMGVRMQRLDGGWAQFATKGYGLTLSAADILMIVTRAFTENPVSSNSSSGCLLDITDAGVNLVTVFVRRAKGIRTFFPDATPDYGRNPACAMALTLGIANAVIEPVPPAADPNCSDPHDPTTTLRTGGFSISVTSSDEKGVNLRVSRCD